MAASLGLSGQLSAGLAISAGIGYATGRAVTRPAAPSVAIQRRGAIVLEQAAEPSEAVHRSRRSLTRERELRGLTLAGMAVGAEDETKHFKLIGTTGTGKSTAIGEMLSALSPAAIAR